MNADACHPCTYLQDPLFKCPGKEKEKRTIVNAYVPRDTAYKGSLAPKEATIARIIYHETKSIDANHSVGYTRNIMIGKVEANSQHQTTNVFVQSVVMFVCVCLFLENH